MEVNKRLPNDVVGEVVPLDIGPLSGELKIHSFEFEPTTVTWKSNRVRVQAHAQLSSRSDGLLGPVEFTVTEGTWNELNESVQGDTDE